MYVEGAQKESKAETLEFLCLDVAHLLNKHVMEDSSDWEPEEGLEDLRSQWKEEHEESNVWTLMKRLIQCYLSKTYKRGNFPIDSFIIDGRESGS